MRGEARRVAAPFLIVAVVLAGYAVPGSTSEDDGLPDLQHQGGGLGEGWVMYRYDANEGHIVMDFEVPTLEGIPIRQFGALGYDADLEFLGGALLTKFYGDEGVRVESSVVGDAPIIDTYDDWSGEGTTSIRIQMNEPGTPYETVDGMRYTLIWGTGGMGEHIHSFYAAPDVELFEVEADLTAKMYVTGHFDSALAARASTGPAGARANAGGAVERTIEGNLIGVFEAAYLASPGDALLAQKPDGSLQLCTCDWLDLKGGSANGPGDYVFRASGAAASPNAADHPRLSVVDVRVPNQELKPDPGQ